MPVLTSAKSEKNKLRTPNAGSKGGGISFSLETITPEQAKDYLATAGEGRRPDARAVGNYARTMKAKAWVVNGQPIIFDNTGHLIDGVQRLLACVEAGVPFSTIVARNVKGDTLHTIDQHRARSYVAVLEARGTYRRPASIVRLMGKLIRIENGLLGLSAMPISWSRYDRVLEANPELIQAVDLADRYRGLKLHSQPVAVLAFMALRAGHGKAFRDFLVALDTDDEEGGAGFDGATNLLSTIEAMRAVGDVDTDQMIALGILAFNDWIEEVRRRKVYKWAPDRRPLREDDAEDPDGATDAETRTVAKGKQRFLPNLGLPTMNGYPGLREGHVADPSRGDQTDSRLVAELRETAANEQDRVQVQMVEVTPEIARRWLQEFNDGNRRTQPTQVAAIARDIKAGRWMVNAQPICFTSDPFAADARRGDTRLLNGQHRLYGVIEADLSIEVPVASGIAESAFATYDTHSRRAVFSSGGPQADHRVLAGAGRFQWRVDEGLSPNDRAVPSASELKETLERHPGLADCFPESRKRVVAEFGSPGVMTFVLYHLRREDPVVAEEFFKDLFTGEHLAKENPVLALRERIRRTRNLEGEKRGSRRQVLSLLLTAWEGYREYRANSTAVSDVAD